MSTADSSTSADRTLSGTREWVSAAGYLFVLAPSLLLAASAWSDSSPALAFVGLNVTALSDERKKLERELSDAKRKLALAGDGASGAPAGPEEVGGVKLIARVLEGVPAKDLRGMVDDGTVFRLGADRYRWIGGDEFGGKWLRDLAAARGLKQVWVKSATIVSAELK